MEACVVQQTRNVLTRQNQNAVRPSPWITNPVVQNSGGANPPYGLNGLLAPRLATQVGLSARARSNMLKSVVVPPAFAISLRLRTARRNLVFNHVSFLNGLSGANAQ
jgi:hypothetical protein